MLFVILRMPDITNLASRPHPQHTENDLVPKQFKYIRPYRDYLDGTFLYMVIEVKFCLILIKTTFRRILIVVGPWPWLVSIVVTHCVYETYLG